MVNDEQRNYLAGRTMAGAIFEQAALTFMVSKGICTAEEVEAVLSVSAAGFKAIEDQPGITNGDSFRIARDHLNAYAAQLPQIEREGAEARGDREKAMAERDRTLADFALGQTFAASVIAKAALRLIVEHGVAPVAAADNLLDVATLGCEQVETDPGMKGLSEPWTIARAEIADFAERLPAYADGADGRLASRLKALHRIGLT